MLSRFGSTHSCEQLLSLMNTKSRTMALLTGENLEVCVLKANNKNKNWYRSTGKAKTMSNMSLMADFFKERHFVICNTSSSLDVI
jgi:hypothetical protein